MAVLGRKLPEATKSKIRASLLGHKHSDEVRAKLKEHLTNLNKNILAKEKGIKVTIKDLETQITTEYDSIRKAAEAIGGLSHDSFKIWKISFG